LDCDVRKAERYSGSTVSRTGLGAPFSYVRIDTDDCGTLVLQGVRKADQGKVADQLQEGGHFSIEVGASSYWFRDTLKLINRYPTAFSYRPGD